MGPKAGLHGITMVMGIGFGDVLLYTSAERVQDGLEAVDFILEIMNVGDS